MSAKTSTEKTGIMPKPDDRTLGYVAATLAFTVQVSYLWVLQEEFLFRPLSGGLMFLAAICQGLVAVSLMFGAGSRMLRFGILLNVSLVVVWIVTRFAGSPGILGFDRLPVEPLNLAMLIAEVGIVVILFSILEGVGGDVREEGR